MSTDSRLHREHKTLVSANALLKSFERHLKAERKAPDTVKHYVGASRQFLDFCADERLPTIANVAREHVEMWLEQLNEAYRPHTVRNRYIGLKMFMTWLAAEGEIDRNPMERIKPPILDESPKDVASPDDVAAVFAMLEKQKRWRDCAMVALLYDTGMRASELADLRTEHLNLDTGVVFIPKTKRHRVRTVRLSAKGVRYVDRYHRRSRADPDYVLNGPRGKMTRSGVYWAVRRAFNEAGIEGVIGAHDLRHTSASHVAAMGEMSESDAMALYGWTDPDMWRHYTAQVRAKAALDAHARSSPLEKLPKRPGTKS